MISQQKPITILGAGSWGTALAMSLARRGQAVRLWSIETAEITAMLKDKANHRYLPGFDLPPSIEPIADLKTAVEQVEDIMMVVPSIGYRQTLALVKPFIDKNNRIICATKGLDTNTGQLLSDVTVEVLGSANKFAVLSGPSFAREVAAGLPTAVMIASKHQSFLADLINRFNSPIFHVYPGDDVTGVEIGGVVKNVIAIAIGISDGMELGANTRSALLTHGLNEIISLGTALGGKLETFIGLSGLGDLILTCTDNQSRNRRLGLALGKGHDIQSAEQEIGQVVEGKRNAELVSMLAKRHHIELPVCETVWQLVQGKVKARDVMQALV